jgi:hypothetical protein
MWPADDIGRGARQYHDTIPVIPRCSGGGCNQGRRPCQTPDACQVPEDEGRGVVAGAIYGLVAWLAVALCFAVVTLGAL